MRQVGLTVDILKRPGCVRCAIVILDGPLARLHLQTTTLAYYLVCVNFSTHWTSFQ
jgi:hypothetical protein